METTKIQNRHGFAEPPTWESVLDAEHFVHARRRGAERIRATDDVAEAIRYIRRAYRDFGIYVPCLGKRGIPCAYTSMLVTYKPAGRPINGTGNPEKLGAKHTLRERY